MSVEARKWEGALQAIGFGVRRIAGELGDAVRDDDVELPWLAIAASSTAPSRDDLARALAGADLVVVENLCSLPLNLPAAHTAAQVLADHPGRVVLHHHDLPWQRPGIGAEGFPPKLPDALHVTINDLSREELSQRGFDATTIHNVFDFSAPAGERGPTRAQFGFAEDDLVLLQPTRAIPRKNVGGGLRFADALAELLPDRTLRYWLTGPAEDGYGAELQRLLATATVTVARGRTSRTVDAYAAADLVVFPSTWEGFGNPVIESVIARRPLAVSGYPVLDEITACGLRFLAVHAPATVAAFVRAPETTILDANWRLARAKYDLAALPARLDAAFVSRGWTEW